MIPISSTSNNRLNSLEEEKFYENQNSSKQSHLKSKHKIDISKVFKFQKIFNETSTITQTRVTHSKQLSEFFGANIYLKREDQQRGKTYKIRGIYEFYINHQEEIKNGMEFVIVSDGNFATAVAILAGRQKFKCKIFVPYSCFEHKIELIKKQSKGYTEIHQVGRDFEECEELAKEYAKENNLKFLQPHQSEQLMIGYATIAKQIIDEKLPQIDFLMVPSGGGALVSSVGSFFKQTMPETKIVAVQPETCTPFSDSIIQNKIISAQKISKLCNGSSVKKIGEVPFKIGKTCVDGFVCVNQNKLAEYLIKLYSIGLVCEPSGALGVAGLAKIRNMIQGKNVICLITGANMDLIRLQQLRELSMISKGYKNYYIINFPKKKGDVYNLITKCFKKTDVISIQYSRKLSKQFNQALLAVQSPTQEDVQEYISKMYQMEFQVENITERSDLLDLFF